MDLIGARVGRRASAIVGVRGPAWMKLARLRGMRSPHGDLGDGNHALVLIKVKDRVFVALDPYSPGTLQPLHVSRDDFAAAWTGEVLFVDSE